MDYIRARLREPSTWRGIVAALMGVGVAIEPGQVEAIVAGCASVIGLIGILTEDRPKAKKEEGDSDQI